MTRSDLQDLEETFLVLCGFSWAFHHGLIGLRINFDWEVSDADSHQNLKSGHIFALIGWISVRIMVFVADLQSFGQDKGTLGYGRIESIIYSIWDCYVTDLSVFLLQLVMILRDSIQWRQGLLSIYWWGKKVVSLKDNFFFIIFCDYVLVFFCSSRAMSQSSLLSKSEGKKVATSGGGLKISVPKFDNSNLIKGYSNTLIGRCLNPAKQDMKALLYMLPRIWQVEDRVVGADLGMGRFQFDFDKDEDIVEVLKMEPYHFEYWMIVLVRWEPVVDINYPSAITFWVKMLGVPLHFWADPTFRAIGDALGAVQEVDIDEGRVRVVLDGFKPLIFSTVVEFHSGEETQVSLRYEKLFGFCRNCFSLCHDQSRCPALRGGVSDGKSFDNPSSHQGQGGRFLSYKTATSHGTDKASTVGVHQSRDHSDRENNKGKEMVRDHRQNKRYEGGDLRAYKLNQSRAGEGSSRSFRHAGYVPPEELRNRYSIPSSGLEKIKTQSVGKHLSDHERKMLEAFHGKSLSPGQARFTKRSKETPKACKELQFDQEMVDIEVTTSVGVEVSSLLVDNVGELDHAQVSVLAAAQTTEGLGLDATKGINLGDVSEVLEASTKEADALAVDDSVSEGLVDIPILSEMDHQELHLSDTDQVDVDQDGVDSGILVPTEEVLEVAKHVQRRKLSRAAPGGVGGSTRKRIVQTLLSPRKRLMPKQVAKGGEGSQMGGDKGTSIPKKVSGKAKVVTC